MSAPGSLARTKRVKGPQVPVGAGLVRAGPWRASAAIHVEVVDCPREARPLGVRRILIMCLHVEPVPFDVVSGACRGAGEGRGGGDYARRKKDAAHTALCARIHGNLLVHALGSLGRAVVVKPMTQAWGPVIPRSGSRSRARRITIIEADSGRSFSTSSP
jgi:hypothetical protein